MDPFEIAAIPGFREPVSCWSHLLGAGVFAVLGVVLLRRGRGSRGRIASLAVFVFSSVFLLSMSGVYHLLDFGVAREVMRRLDHAAIWALIAGTFTPVFAILFHGWRRWGSLLLIWSMAITGITLKTIFFADLAQWLGILFYLAMGWIGAFWGFVLWRQFGTAFVKPLCFGALAYTIGASFEYFQQPLVIPNVIGPHELFHVAVLLGVAYHWQFVYQFAAGTSPSQRATA